MSSRHSPLTCSRNSASRMATEMPITPSWEMDVRMVRPCIVGSVMRSNCTVLSEAKVGVTATHCLESESRTVESAKPGPVARTIDSDHQSQVNQKLVAKRVAKG